MVRRGRAQSPFTLFSFQDIITSVTGIFVLVTLMLAYELSCRTPSFSEGLEPKQEDVTGLRQAVADMQQEVQSLQTTLDDQSRPIRALAQKSVNELRSEVNDRDRQAMGLAEDVNKLASALDDANAKHSPTPEEDRRRAANQAELKHLQQKLAEYRRKAETIKSEDWLVFRANDQIPNRAWIVDATADRIQTIPLRPGLEGASFKGPALLRHQQFQVWAQAQGGDQSYFLLLIRPSGADEYAPLRKILEATHAGMGYDVLGEDRRLVPPGAEAVP